MIKIKNMIFPESELEYLYDDDRAKRVYVKIKGQHNEITFYNITILDIQWNYDKEIKTIREIYNDIQIENEKLRKENEHYIEVLKKLNELYSDITVKCDFSKYDEKNKMYFELKNTRKQDLLYTTNKCKMIVKYTVNSIEMDK